jgi:tRNA1(Val) A37 N6-methylase TrmN6
MEEWRCSALECGFHTSRVTFVKTTPRKAPKRVLVEFCRTTCGQPLESILILENTPGEYSYEAKEILRDFYLKID